MRRWEAADKIQCYRTPGGHRRISLLEISRLRHGTPVPPPRKVAIYCRVSSHQQKAQGDLARQVQAAKTWCAERGYAVHSIFTDVGSGLNARRRGLQQLCRLVEQGALSKVVLTYPDRLTRFGFDYLRAYFQSHGTTIELLYARPTRSMQQELVDDLLAIVTSFSGRLHGMRSHRNRKKSSSA
ncbi:MAG: IS607 family transposase [Candidatus Helarchaeota archaeon]